MDCLSNKYAKHLQLCYGNFYHYLVKSISNALKMKSDFEDQTDSKDTVTAELLEKGRSVLKSGFNRKCTK